MCPSSERFTSPFEVDFFVLKRRPQAGLVLSTRRVFQVTKTPRYLGLMGCASQEKNIGIIELDDGKIETGKPQQFDGKKPWVSGVDFPLNQSSDWRNSSFFEHSGHLF